jgi:hypothetical protein
MLLPKDAPVERQRPQKEDEISVLEPSLLSEAHVGNMNDVGVRGLEQPQPDEIDHKASEIEAACGQAGTSRGRELPARR